MLLTTKDVAQRLGCSEDTVARLRAANLLQDVRIGRSVRITSTSLDAYITSLTGGAFTAATTAGAQRLSTGRAT